MGDRSTAAMPDRLDNVTISVDSRHVHLTWPVRTALLDQLRRDDTGEPIVKAFEDVDATSPVELTLEQKADLLLALETWGLRAPNGFKTLPYEIFALRNALYDDLHDAEQRKAN